MTGTAETEMAEFLDIYKLDVVVIPTNKPVIREDCKDLLFATKEGKYKAIVNEIIERHKKGQPVLVGTIAVETSELISERLRKKGIPHEVLNAKNHAREAEIISHAGEKGAITIATNMAGRGTDIKLGEGVKELGGLCVLGTERHESRRIDNQLRGRSGRQGDPGFSQFCVSFEDDLMVRFGADRAKNILARAGFSGDAAIRNSALAKSIETAQKRVEGNNYDIRKTLLEYDNVINEQREIIYDKRNEILDSDSIHERILDTFRSYVEDVVFEHTLDGKFNEEDIKEMTDYFENEVGVKIDDDDFNINSIEETTENIYNKIVDKYNEKMDELPEEIRNDFEKAISLRVIDTHWMEHINTMSHLREGIYLRGYAQENPLRAYKSEGYEMFDDLLARIDRQTSVYLLRAEVRQNTERKEVAKNTQTNQDQSTVKKAQPKRVSKIGRNEKCPCGSGKKYKQCCGK
jgi:preprotein translocase subunit SecA